MVEAAAAKIIKPILVGPEARIRAFAASLHLDIRGLEVVDQPSQITGGVLDGPPAFDNAISKEVAASKHVNSPVAGDADILLVPDL